MNKIAKAGMSVAVFTTILMGGGAVKASAATWSTTDKYGSWSNSGYTLNNDVWGEGSGAQTMWGNSYSNWGVWSAQPNTGGIKSYPHVEKVINRKVSAVNTLKSSFNVTVPISGTSMETAYDIWLHDPNYSNPDSKKNKHEIMIWMNKFGDVNPISYGWDASGPIPVYRNVSIGGQTWNVYYGDNTQNMVYSFVRTGGNVNSGSVDIKAITNWIKSTPKWYGDIQFDNVQFGYEITSSYNNGKGQNFNTNNFSVTFN
ncbi:GH12 family glycosyl hydrolase domain-containing protein [Clostridium saccharobutylicum]|uniref:Endoglucanase S n=1 Tax=Clostridium saccharobutylicum TaxID=169679 RepID=A0A1S8N2H1_CLOSA|nr:glycosyl hydrolase [Clostridium saccharobutylicum]OOM10716.1 endoglucanase S precursor [Clostridium saccharobutylicum]